MELESMGDGDERGCMKAYTCAGQGAQNEVVLMVGADVTSREGKIQVNYSLPNFSWVGSQLAQQNVERGRVPLNRPLEPLVIRRYFLAQ